MSGQDAPAGAPAAAFQPQIAVQMTAVQIEPQPVAAAAPVAQHAASNGTNGQVQTNAANIADLEEYFAELEREKNAAGTLDVLMQPVKAGFAKVDQTLSAVPGVNMVKNVAGKGLDMGIQGLEFGVDLGKNILAPGVEGLKTGVNVVGKATVAAAGKGLDLVTGVGKEGLQVVGKGVNMVTNQVGTVAEKVLPQDLIVAAKITREVAMERLNDAQKVVEDLLNDPTWRELRNPKKGFRLWNYYRAQLFYVVGSCVFWAGLILLHDPQPPDNIVDAIFMTVSAMSGAGLITIPMSQMSNFSLVVHWFLMLGGGIAFLLLPPILWRIYQYRRFKPTVKKVILLREKLRNDTAESLAAFENDMLQDFELQDQGLRVLAAVIIGYNFFFLFIGTFIFHGFMAAYGPLQALADNNIKPLHFSAFAAVSSFNNVGLSLLDDNYTSLYNRGAVLMLMCFMIVCGNTGLPIMLRVIMTILARLRPNSKAIRFVLDNPRRCTVAFFNAKQTAALFLVLLFNLFFQFFFFLGTSINKPEIRELANWDQLVTMGWFQSCSTRAAGMNVFDLRALSKAMAVIYCVMMWISSAPMVSMMEATRQTVVAKYVNGEVILVYEGGDGDDTHPFKKYLNSHLRWLGVIFLLIATAEEKLLSTLPPVNLFDVLFEIMSAYGTSGLSMGGPGLPYSLCGAFSPFSKILLIIVKLMGKHRGLPSNSDAALDGQYIRIHSMLLHLEAQAKHRMGKGEAPKAPEWIIEEQKGRRGARKGGLLDDVGMGGQVGDDSDDEGQGRRRRRSPLDAPAVSVFSAEIPDLPRRPRPPPPTRQDSLADGEFTLKR